MDVIFDIRQVKAISDFLKQGVKKPAQDIIKNSSTLMKNEATKNLKQVVYNRSVPWERTRDLLQSITIDKKSNLYHRVYVGMPYGIFVENGTKPHTIKATKAKVLAFSVGGKMVFASSVNHPGSKPYPFWKPAGETLIKKMPSIVEQAILNWENTNT